MSRSAIYTANQNVQTISDGGILNLGTMIRRFGCNLQLSGNAILAAGCGYYDVVVSITCAPGAIGTITATLLKDGVPVQGGVASASVTAANGVVDLNIPALVRLVNDAASNLTVRLSGVATTSVSNVGVKVIKL